MDGKLFSQDFLLKGITDTPVWKDLTTLQLNEFKQALSSIFANLQADSVINEANTESDIIDKVLNLLGWQDLSLKQVTATQKRREDIPDYLLFANSDKKQQAQLEKKEDRRYLHGLCVLEAKSGYAH